MTREPLILAAAALCLPVGSALAQNALGDGRGLQRTGIRDLAPMDFAREVRLRNAVVTGNAPGGRSLQIASPYADADDFRAALGTDSLFRFRRDSYNAGLGVGLRGTESIQYQYAFTTGNTRDPGVVSRLSGGASTAPVAAPRAVYSSTIFDRGGTDATAPELGTLRSTAAFNAVRGLSPTVVGVRQTREGVERVTASSLLGVRSTLLVPDMMTGRYVEPEDRRATTGPAATPAGGAASTPAGTTPVEQPPTRTAFDELMERLRATPAPGVTPAPTTPPPETPSGESPSATTDPAAAWEASLRTMRDKLAPATPARPGQPASTPRDGFSATDEELLRAFRESSGEVRAYLRANPNPGDLFGTYVKEGEEMIGARQYFDAEERFARALAMKPGDVTAMTGRLHAQLGGGLYLSAAMNLRHLYQQHPEVIAVRFAGATMPDAQRLSFIKAELVELLDASAQRRKPPSPEAALLLAYVGYQTSDRTSLERGLRVLESERLAQADMLGEPTPPPDPLLALLRAAWTGTPLPKSPAPSTEPAPK